MTDTATRSQLWDLIKDIRFAMFTTRHAENGHLHARPMTMQNKGIDEDDALWFFMPREGDAVQDIRHESEVNVAFADPDKQNYVSVAGHADIVEDAELRRRLWSKPNEAWFHQGPDDPQAALVKVTITHADYWDASASKLVRLYQMAKAVVTGQSPRDLGDHGHVRMN